MKILIVEDEEFSRQMLQGQLRNLGHEVVAVASGDEAWELLQREEFPLIITDWMMPGLDGLDLVRLIRARERSHYVYIILLTAKTENRDVVEGILAGADDFLTKPHDSDELSVRIRAGERIIDLEKRLNAQNEELADSKSKLEYANQRMKGDLEAAARIQRSLLPSTTLDNKAIDFAWIYEPCDELAGDIFNLFQVDQENIVFYLLDVVGHGVSSALLSVTLSRLLSPLTGSSMLFASDSTEHRLLSPSELATELNKRFPMSDDGGQYFTLLLGSLNLETRQCRFVSAGHPGPVYMPVNDTPEILDASGFPIGIVEEPGYVDQTVSLSPGDRLILYSDGLLDAEDPSGSFFGKEGLMESVTDHHHSLEEAIESLRHRVVSWCDGQSANDDISVLAVSLLED
jgi:sigma-B regulation protein RsbU (phosphoserine phosphatase)